MISFDTALKMGKEFELVASKVLECIFYDCEVRDTSEDYRRNDRKYPDFEIWKNKKLICLVDAKCKKIYQHKFVGASKDFIDDYIWHSNKANVPCSLLFGINGRSWTQSGAFFLLKDVKGKPDKIAHFDNAYGNDPVYRWDINKPQIVKINVDKWVETE